MPLRWRLQKTDRPGNDYAQRLEQSAEACRTLCSRDGNCQAFTFVKPLSGAGGGQWYLKRSTSPPVADRCFISAQRKSAEEAIAENIR